MRPSLLVAVKGGIGEIAPRQMKITEDVRKYAAEQGIAEEEALKAGMEQKAREFVEKGAETECSPLHPAFCLRAKPLNSLRRRRMAIEEASAKVAIFIEQNLKCFAKFLFWLV